MEKKSLVSLSEQELAQLKGGNDVSADLPDLPQILMV